jgi:N-acetylneuraminic acid mutarotase
VNACLTLRITVAFSLLSGAAFTTAAAAEIPVNKWAQVAGGEFPAPAEKTRRLSLVGHKLIHIPGADKVIILPGRQHGPTVEVWEAAVGKTGWSLKSTSGLAKELCPYNAESPFGCCYLPGLKKVMLFKQERRRGKVDPVAAFLLDPIAGKWEAVKSGVAMGEKSSRYNPFTLKGRFYHVTMDQYRIPINGQLVYDAHNREAVAFGGYGTWGRVSRKAVAVEPGHWIYDEKLKRTRRLTGDDEGKVTKARRWHPAHSGTWVFPESNRKWEAIPQPIGDQPSPRVLPGMAYDSAEKKIVLFGGDDLAHCMDDTWVYDCKQRTWAEVKPLVAPQARAGHAMVYLPDAQAILVAGGYAGGWRMLKDVWVYRTRENRWERLGIDLPRAGTFASGCYVPKTKSVLVASYPQFRSRDRTVPVYGMRLNLASAPRASKVKEDPRLAYHCKHSFRYNTFPTDLPDEWLEGKGRPESREAVLSSLKALPANTWKALDPPKKVVRRCWGSYRYDARSHKLFAWGGGHSGYPGGEINTYDLLTNRWTGYAQPTNYMVVWWQGGIVRPPGPTFAGWAWAVHSRKSYGVDPLSDSVITRYGDVFSIRHRSVVTHIDRFPASEANWNLSCVTAPHGLYGLAQDNANGKKAVLCRANVAAGKWDVIHKDGPMYQSEHNFMCHDSKRDRILYFWRQTKQSKESDKLWVFDFKTRKWSEERPAGPAPAPVFGDGAYIPAMDAVLVVFGDPKAGREGRDTMYFYKCDERKWYTAPHVGEHKHNPNRTGRDSSIFYDPELKLVLRATTSAGVGIHVMRLVPEKLKLTAWK